MALTWVSAASGLRQKLDYAALKSRWTRWQHGCLSRETTQPRQTLVVEWSGLICRGVIAIVASATASCVETGLIIINVNYSVMGTFLGVFERSDELHLIHNMHALDIVTHSHGCVTIRMLSETSPTHILHVYIHAHLRRAHVHDCMRLYIRMH
jgi:hypothetical protein